MKRRRLHFILFFVGKSDLEQNLPQKKNKLSNAVTQNTKNQFIIKFKNLLELPIYT